MKGEVVVFIQMNIQIKSIEMINICILNQLGHQRLSGFVRIHCFQSFRRLRGVFVLRIVRLFPPILSFLGK